MYIPKHFCAEELVYPDFFARFKNRGNRIFMAFDARALITLDRLRTRYGPIIVNNWHTLGESNPQARIFSGLRPFNCPVGAQLSQHIWGRAFDCKFQNVEAHEVRKECLGGYREGGSVFAFVTRIEDFPGMGWFHFDTGNHDAAAHGIKVLTPGGVN